MKRQSKLEALRAGSLLIKERDPISELREIYRITQDSITPLAKRNACEDAGIDIPELGSVRWYYFREIIDKILKADAKAHKAVNIEFQTHMSDAEVRQIVTILKNWVRVGHVHSPPGFGPSQCQVYW